MKQRYYLCGVLGSVASIGLFQDIIGKEAYLKMVENCWVPGIYSIPIEISALIMVIWLYYKK